MASFDLGTVLLLAGIVGGGMAGVTAARERYGGLLLAPGSSHHTLRLTLLFHQSEDFKLRALLHGIKLVNPDTLEMKTVNDIKK